MLTRIYTIINHHRFWWVVIALAVILRLVGLTFGLPLFLVADEPSAIFGALKMLELKTIIPALHSAEFASVLYYPPYLSYLFLLPFAVVGGLKFLLSGQSLEVFTNLLIVDSSIFFILARLLSITASVVSIILIYQVARRLFATAPAWVATLAAFFLVVSPTYLALGSVARHWSFIGLLIAVILRLLVSDLKRKYFWSFLTAGLAMGISTIAGVGVVLTLMWLVFIERRGGLIKWRELLAGLISFSFLAWLPNLLYPQSLGFVNDVSLLSDKSFWGALFSTPQFLLTAGRVEILLVALAAAGLVWLIYNRQKFGWLVAGFTIFYCLLFYFFFHFETRFLTPLLPLFALTAAYAAWRLATVKVSPWGTVIIVLICLAMLATGLRFTRLIYQDDTRALAYDWALDNIPAGSRVVVAGELLRLPVVEVPVGKFARRTDQAEVSLAKAGIDYGPAFDALNLYTFDPVVDQGVVLALIGSAPADYVIIDDDSPWQTVLSDVLTSGEEIKDLTGSGERFLYTAGHFWGFPWELWQFDQFGPDLTIYGF